MLDIDWRKIRTHKTSQRSAFEELVCQLAYKEKIHGTQKFIRVEAPDGGVEAYYVLANGSEIGWQAKFFIDGLGAKQWKQIEESFKRAVIKNPLFFKFLRQKNNPPLVLF